MTRTAQESPVLTPTSQGPWAPFITIDPSAPPELVAQVSAAEAAIIEVRHILMTTHTPQTTPLQSSYFGCDHLRSASPRKQAQRDHSVRSIEGAIPTASARLIAFLEDQVAADYTILKVYTDHITPNPPTSYVSIRLPPCSFARSASDLWSSRRSLARRRSRRRARPCRRARLQLRARLPWIILACRIRIAGVIAE